MYADSSSLHVDLKNLLVYVDVKTRLVTRIFCSTLVLYASLCPVYLSVFIRARHKRRVNNYNRYSTLS